MRYHSRYVGILQERVAQDGVKSGSSARGKVNGTVDNDVSGGLHIAEQQTEPYRKALLQIVWFPALVTVVMSKGWIGKDLLLETKKFNIYAKASECLQNVPELERQ